MVALVLVTFVNLFVPAFSAALLLRVILSYFVSPGNGLMDFLIGLTEPLLAPVRRMIPAAPGVDFAPLVALLLLQGLQYLVHGLL